MHLYFTHSTRIFIYEKYKTSFKSFQCQWLNVALWNGDIIIHIFNLWAAGYFLFVIIIWWYYYIRTSWAVWTSHQSLHTCNVLFYELGTGSLSVLSFLCLKKTLFLFKNAVSNILFYVECQQEYCRRMFFNAKRCFYDIKFIGILTHRIFYMKWWYVIHNCW